MDSQLVAGRIVSFDFNADLKGGKGSKSRFISGYANKNVVDRTYQRVDPIAYLSSKDDFMLKNPVMFFNHDWNEPIGKIVELKVTEDGLFVKGQIGEGYDLADKVWKMIEQGLLRTFSIGFRPKKIEYDAEEEVEVIKDLELLEVSVAAIPVNQDSIFEVSAKGAKLAGSFEDAVKGKTISTEDIMKELNKTDTDTEIDVQPVSKALDGECSLCGYKGFVLEVGVNVYGKSFNACAPCLSESGKIDEIKKNAQKLEEQVSELSAKLGEAESALSESFNNYKELAEQHEVALAENEQLKSFIASEAVELGRIAVNLIDSEE